MTGAAARLLRYQKAAPSTMSMNATPPIDAPTAIPVTDDDPDSDVGGLVGAVSWEVDETPGLD